MILPYLLFLGNAFLLLLFPKRHDLGPHSLSALRDTKLGQALCAVVVRWFRYLGTAL